MAKFYMMGNYTTQGFQGFCKDPSSDRSKAAQVAADAVGAKMISYSGLRGAFDFVVVAEEININNAAGNAAKVASAYKGPGK